MFKLKKIIIPHVHNYIILTLPNLNRLNFRYPVLCMLYVSWEAWEDSLDLGKTGPDLKM